MMYSKSDSDQPVTWHKDDLEVRDGDDSYSTSVDGDICTLTLPKSELADSAEYTVTNGDEDIVAQPETAGKNWLTSQMGVFTVCVPGDIGSVLLD